MGGRPCLWLLLRQGASVAVHAAGSNQTHAGAEGLGHLAGAGVRAAGNVTPQAGP